MEFKKLDFTLYILTTLLVGIFIGGLYFSNINNSREIFLIDIDKIIQEKTIELAKSNIDDKELNSKVKEFITLLKNRIENKFNKDDLVINSKTILKKGNYIITDKTEEMKNEVLSNENN
ncbi:MAG: hypothetical protein J0H68_09395 [Sphingobacteriia bacterium]|nr:hypothetical protein [Sphingobacteriia bacterium]